MLQYNLFEEEMEEQLMINDLVASILDRNEALLLSHKIFDYINDNFEKLRKYHNKQTLQELIDLYKKEIVASFMTSIERNSKYRKKIFKITRRYDDLDFISKKIQDNINVKIFRIYEEYLNDIYIMLITQ